MKLWLVKMFLVKLALGSDIEMHRECRALVQAQLEDLTSGFAFLSAITY